MRQIFILFLNIKRGVTLRVKMSVVNTSRLRPFPAPLSVFLPLARVVVHPHKKKPPTGFKTRGGSDVS